MEVKEILYMYTALLHFRNGKYKHLQNLIIIEWKCKHGWRFITLLQFGKKNFDYLNASSEFWRDLVRLSVIFCKWGSKVFIYMNGGASDIFDANEILSFFIEWSSDFYRVYFCVSIWNDTHITVP